MSSFEVSYTDNREPRTVEARGWTLPSTCDPLAHIAFIDGNNVVVFSVARFAVESIEWKRDDSEQSTA